jgi:hypothetical protein
MNEPKPSTWYKVPYLTARHHTEVYPGITYFVSTAVDHREKTHYKRQENDIIKFSNKSRVRALQRLNMIDPEQMYTPHFITLTYHNTYPESARDIKKELDSYLKRLARALPHAYYFWRIELQKRGAPHYHLILWINRKDKDITTGDLLNLHRKIWTSHNHCGCSHCRSNSVKIDLVDDMRKATYYTAKYLAKSEEININVGIGRLWGNSRSLPLCQKSLYSGNNDFITMLQFTAVLWSLQYTLSNPEYLLSLLSRASIFIFIPSQIVQELHDAILSGALDPVSYVSTKLGLQKKRTLEEITSQLTAQKETSPTVSEASGSVTYCAGSPSPSYALHANEIVRRCQLSQRFKMSISK